MGIKYLNPFLMEYANNGIYQLNLNDDFFSNKTIIIDVSIYMYKFSEKNNLLENFHKLLMIFDEYKIKPIFVFDGKPTDEKQKIINKRKEEKLIAKQKHDELLKNNESNKDEYELFMLKKQFQHIRKTEFEKVKNILKLWNCPYIEAPNEADLICLQLMKHKTLKPLGCLTDDMDFIAFGSSFVFRQLNLATKTVIVYDLQKIINQLKMTFEEFQDFICCCGIDYESKTLTEIEKIFELFQIYKQTEVNTITFVEWYKSKTGEQPINIAMNDETTNYEEIVNQPIAIKNPIEYYNKKYQEILLTEEGFIPIPKQ
jgi:5'-3' exonuclease